MFDRYSTYRDILVNKNSKLKTRSINAGSLVNTFNRVKLSIVKK